MTDSGRFGLRPREAKPCCREDEVYVLQNRPRLFKIIMFSKNKDGGDSQKFIHGDDTALRILFNAHTFM